ncbi:hypothetical protein N0V88_001918 [Collariella sp. IMI 366227]|nr:hypothetical protein N0V88_001918 [Collariella sp. IMI 366227]
MTPVHDWASSDERRAFQFFQYITAPCLSGGVDGAFWSVLVLQMCQSELAVRHAVLAVSTLHESMVQAATATPYLNTKNRCSFALQQYNRAIACLLDHMRAIDARPLVPLLTCVLFVTLEFIQSKDKESLLHLGQGRQILSQIGRKTTIETQGHEIDLIKKHLVPIYTRLNLTSLMFGCESTEIPTSLKTLTEVPMVFETIDDVRYSLYDLMDECLRFAKKSHVAMIEEIVPDQMRAFEQEQDRLFRKLAKFKVAFSLYRSTTPRNALAGSIALIQIHIHTTFIWISTALSRHETIFDDHVDTFSTIIPLAIEFVETRALSPHTTQLPTDSAAPTPDMRRFSDMFTFEMHIIAPLYFVAAKCRHPMIRRAALDILRRNPTRRENLWRADVMAAIAKRTMRLEEKHLGQPNTDSHPQTQTSLPPNPSLSPFDFGSNGQVPNLLDAHSSSIFGPDLSQMEDDPTLPYDPIEDLAADFSFSPSNASSLEDFGGPPPDSPFDIPERFRVHESIIGPHNKADGTSWVMLFRKMGGLKGEWDVVTEYVTVT